MAFRCQAHDVVLGERACAPADEAFEDVRVARDEGVLGAEHLEALPQRQLASLRAKTGRDGWACRWIHGGARLGNDGLAIVLPQPLRHVPERLHVVRRALLVRPRVILIQILVQVKVQAVPAAIRVGNLVQRIRTARDHEGLDIREVGAGQQNQVVGGAGLADGRHGGLARLRPAHHLEAVRLIHDTKGHPIVVGVEPGQLGQEGGEDGVGRAALGDHSAVVAGKVVDVDDAVCARVETGLHELVEDAKILLVQSAAKVVVEQVLPC